MSCFTGGVWTGRYSVNTGTHITEGHVLRAAASYHSAIRASRSLREMTNITLDKTTAHMYWPEL